MADRYRVKAVWLTLQGEGGFAGRPAVFVRFVGCNMWSGYEEDRSKGKAPCSRWCDTDFTKEGSTEYTAHALAEEMLRVGGAIRFCVLTGGEPFLQADAELMKALHAAGFMVAIETNGSIAIREAFLDADTGEVVPPDWIVCSPKTGEDDLAIEYFDEIKIVVPDYDLSGYTEFLKRQRMHTIADRPYPLKWIQPEDGPRLNDARRLAIETALQNPGWRVSVQTHKILDVE